MQHHSEKGRKSTLSSGRPSNNLKVGIVGLPNVGKSSFFNALSKTGTYTARSAMSSRPSVDSSGLVSLLQILARPPTSRTPPSTLKVCILLADPLLYLDLTFYFAPPEARIPVPDARFEWLCDLYKPVNRIPAFLTCIDIAGLTAVRLHASTGWRLGF